MYRLTREQRVAVLNALVEGCSVRSTVRLTGISKPTILTLLLDIGRVCNQHHDSTVRGVYAPSVEADECWGFCYCKEKNVARAKRPVEGAGSVWTWYAIASQSKMILSWIAGGRDAAHADALMQDLASRLTGRPQITTDALKLYASAVFDAFALGCDYATIHKEFGRIPEDGHQYSPPQCTGVTKTPVFGSPRMEKASTSYIERANLSLRTSQRRWTRLSSGHSKSFSHMLAAFALHVTWFNFVRKHATLGTTPAVAQGVAAKPWTMGDVVALLEADEARQEGKGQF